MIIFSTGICKSCNTDYVRSWSGQGEVKDQQEKLQEKVGLREVWQLKGGFRASSLGGSWV